MVLALEIRISLGSLLEGKDFVYHWADLTRCKQSVHVLKLFDRANQNSAENDRLQDHKGHRNTVIAPGHKADDMNPPSIAYGIDRFQYSIGPPDFNDVVNATAAGDVQDFFVPFNVLLVVDGVLHAQFLCNK